MSTIDALKLVLHKALETEMVSITPSIDINHNQSRWGYIDNDFSDADHTQAVLFAAVEYELADVQYHPEPDHAAKMALHAKDLIKEEILDRDEGMGDRWSVEFRERTRYCSQIHNGLMDAGFLISDLVSERHGGGINTIVRYSRLRGDGLNYCDQLRVVYVPCEFNEYQAAAAQYHDPEMGLREYVVANYEGGELTNLDTHDFQTGQLLRRLYVEQVETRYDRSPVIAVEDDLGIYGYNDRLSILTHRREFIAHGERHTFYVLLETHDQFTAYRRIVVERFDYRAPETITPAQGNM